MTQSIFKKQAWQVLKMLARTVLDLSQIDTGNYPRESVYQ